MPLTPDYSELIARLRANAELLNAEMQTETDPHISMNALLENDAADALEAQARTVEELKHEVERLKKLVNEGGAPSQGAGAHPSSHIQGKA